MFRQRPLIASVALLSLALAAAESPSIAGSAASVGIAKQTKKCKLGYAKAKVRGKNRCVRLIPPSKGYVLPHAGGSGKLYVSRKWTKVGVGIWVDIANLQCTAGEPADVGYVDVRNMKIDPKTGSFSGSAPFQGQSWSSAVKGRFLGSLRVKFTGSVSNYPSFDPDANVGETVIDTGPVGTCSGSQTFQFKWTRQGVVSRVP